MRLIQRGPLVAPEHYWHLHPETKEKFCNGCGPQGGIGLRILSYCIPDSFFTLDISEACNIHDYCYIIGMDKKEADNLFLDNMTRLIDKRGGCFRGVRHVLAFHYWLAVKNLGKGSKIW
jgi:hypothetical protein